MCSCTFKVSWALKINLELLKILPHSVFLQRNWTNQQNHIKSRNYFRTESFYHNYGKSIFSSVYTLADNFLPSNHKISMIQMLVSRDFGMCSDFGIFWNNSIHSQPF